jgi:hypothetical protein
LPSLFDVRKPTALRVRHAQLLTRANVGDVRVVNQVVGRNVVRRVALELLFLPRFPGTEEAHVVRREPGRGVDVASPFGVVFLEPTRKAPTPGTHPDARALIALHEWE